VSDIPELKRLEKQLHQLQPDDPRTYMLRAIFNDRLEKSMLSLEQQLAAIGTLEYNVTPYRVTFKPFVQGAMLKQIMSSSFGVKTNHFPIRIPPKYWGVKIINHTPFDASI